jgi:hypothetical protein
MLKNDWISRVRGVAFARDELVESSLYLIVCVLILAF